VYALCRRILWAEQVWAYPKVDMDVRSEKSTCQRLHCLP
jgi:hypothetical protein